MMMTKKLTGIVQDITSEQPSRQLDALIDIRKILDSSLSIELIISLNISKIIISLMYADNFRIMLESVRVLSVLLASNNSIVIKLLIDQGAANVLVQLLSRPHSETTIIHLLLSIGNIAGQGFEFSNYLLKLGLLKTLLLLISHSHPEVSHKALWVLSNLCGRLVYTFPTALITAFPILLKLLNTSNDPLVLQETLWCIITFAKNTSRQDYAIFSNKIIHPIVCLTIHPKIDIHKLAIQTLGFISLNVNSDLILSSGFIKNISFLVKNNSNSMVVTEVLYALGNTIDSLNGASQLIASELFEIIVKFCRDSFCNLENRVEAMYCVANTLDACKGDISLLQSFYNLDVLGALQRFKSDFNLKSADEIYNTVDEAIDTLLKDVT